MKWSSLYLLTSILWGGLLQGIVVVASDGGLCRDDGEDCLCRRDPRLVPHQNGLWKEGFPDTDENHVALCNGEITLAENGEICVDGRVSYGQLLKFVKRSSNFTKSHSIYSPASLTISITGHLATGSGNLVHGPSASFLYDFVTSYTVNGTNYTSDSTMIDRLLGASQGTIDGVCFDPSFVQEETFYDIRHEMYSPSDISSADITGSNMVFASNILIVAEYHTVRDSAPSAVAQRIGKARYLSFSIATNFPTPQFTFNLIPIFSFSGLLRRTIVGSISLSTSFAFRPLTAPDLRVEDAQLDTDWDTFMLAVNSGVLAELPSGMSVIAKKISPLTTNGCWDVDVASIDFQVPLGFSDDLDTYIEDVFYPKLLELNSSVEVTFHFGKRILEGSTVLQAALNKYESCGATLNPTVETCYHPMCARTTTPSDFEYPATYFTEMTR